MMKTKSMCEGKPLPLIFFFSLPLMLGNICQQLYTVMDTMIVSQKLGVEALAALGCCDWLNWMGFGIMTGFAQGFSIMVSHAFGMKIKEKIQESILSMLVCCLVVSVVFVVVALPCMPLALQLLNTPDAIFDMTLLYTKIIFLGLPITMFYNAFAAILRALGNSKAPLFAMVLASVVNIILDLLFVMVFEIGIAGAGIATLIAQFVAGCYCVFKLIQIKDVLPKRLCKDTQVYLHLMKLGFPMALQNVLISIGGMVLTSVINRYGTLFLAGFTAVNKLYGILEVSAVSYGYAMVTYTGQNYGARQYDRIKQGVRSAVMLSVITAICISIGLFLFGKNLLSFFISADGAVYEEVMGIAWTFLQWMAWFLPVLYLLHIYRSTIQGLSDTLIPMLSGMFELIVRIAVACLLPICFGRNGLYPVEVLAWFGAVVLLIPSYYSKERKLMKK